MRIRLMCVCSVSTFIMMAYFIGIFPVVRIDYRKVYLKGTNMTNMTVFTNDLNAPLHDNSSARVNSVTQTMNLEEWLRLRDYRGQISCLPLFDKNSTISPSAKKFSKRHPRKPVPDSFFLNFTRNCTEFKRKRGYVMKSNTDEDFPIAYSILFYKEIEQLEFLLRAIYRPQNIYCLHLDKFHSKELLDATISLTRCFDNVFIASQLENVVYAGYSRLQADINCMKDLVGNNVKWKYLINLASQAFPMKTNEELVQILKVFNGSNDIAGRTGDAVIKKRSNRGTFPTISKISDQIKEVPSKNGSEKPGLKNTLVPNSPPPHNLTILKGLAYAVFSRGFVEFVLTDKKAWSFLEWCKTTYGPDEHFWQTLNGLHDNAQLNTPGGFLGVPNKSHGVSIFVKWGKENCASGKLVHNVCILGIDHLPLLKESNKLFANKFHFDFEYPALYCLNEWLESKRTNGNVDIDLSQYRRLPFVRNHN